ncbi:protein OBERON 4-like [Populus alba x Populus x berolinensis]|nr:protein OBERON 4-like [Populus alba x Populus x berolinensis]
MKRLRSSDDLDSYNEKSSVKDSNPSRSSRSFYNKSDNVRKGLISSSSSSSRYDRDRSTDEDNRESSRMVRKRSDHEFDSFDRRKGLGLGFDRYGSGGSSNSREGYSGSGGGNDRVIHRPESLAGSRREFPKGFRSERERSRREVSVSSWRRFGSKEFEESRSGGGRGGNEERMGSARSSPKGLRDVVRSPSWSRDSGSEQTRVARGSGSGRDEAKVKRSNSKSRSSPTWSKDSGSERSKSVEVGKKSEAEPKSVEVEAKSVEMEVKAVQSGNCSEIEEGELEPEPDSVPKVAKEDESDNVNEELENVKVDIDHRKVETEAEVKELVNEETRSHKENVNEGKDVVKEAGEKPNVEENSNDSVSEDEVGNTDGDGDTKDSKSLKEKVECRGEVSKNVIVEESLNLEENNIEDKGIDLEVKADDVEVIESNKEIVKENGGTEVNINMVTEISSQNMKDKGKSVAVSPINAPDSAEDGTWAERESRNVATFRNEEDDMEGPSTRGFELFSTSPVRRVEKAEESSGIKSKDEKLLLEPLDLSLSLPNVLLPIGATGDTGQAPGSPSHGRSVQSFSSFRTNSDGFTASMSFSGSQSFYHNPSCSLTQNSLDMDNYEQSVHSRPIFQGIDQTHWQGQTQNDSKHKDVPLYQKILMNGNGSLHQPQAVPGLSNGQALQGTSKMHNELERQLSFHRQLPGGQARNHDDTRSPSQSVGSHDIGSTYSFEKKRTMKEKHGSSLSRSNSQKELEQFLMGGADFAETIVGRIVSEPIHVMAKKFHEMTAQSASCLKESIREILLNANKQGQACAFQSMLQNRSELTLDMLLKSHRVQLEVLVALRTGLPEYLQVDSGISSSDLAEVFLNLRCRNLTCQSHLPVDECDCKVCVKKNGFCSSCMCLVCSKFDMASNTCSWVGCDVCLHWCHADCALREACIRNGRSVSGAQGTTEMQFHCVACDHPSEMFGFVKEVFQNFAKDWTAETFCRELEYVKRIFCASKDLRGRRLHEIADQMLAKLANKSILPEVYNYIMGFLTESDPSKCGNASGFSGKEQGNGSNGTIAGPSQDTAWFKSVYAEKTPQLQRSTSFHSDLNDKRPVGSELLRSAQKEPLFDELESIVRIKQAEAKMFQARADDARREAEGLKRIVIAKSEKIEEEHAGRLSKLHIVEAEEMRRQRFEEFQSLERAHQEYFSMKMRMEADIKDLVLKMEATKRNLTM